MQELGRCIEIRDIIVKNPVDRELEDLLSKGINYIRHEGVTQDNLRCRKKTMIDQKRQKKKDQVSFLTKTYLELNVVERPYTSQRRINKRKLDNKTTAIEIFKQSSEFEKIEFDQDTDELHQYRGRQAAEGEIVFQRSIKSSVARTAFNPKPAVQMAYNQYSKDSCSRKTSSTSKKLEQQPIIEESKTSSSVRPIKSVPFIKYLKQYVCVPESKYLSAILSRNGFIESKDDSPSLFLKWTEKEQVEEYANLQNEVLKYYNHIKNNPLLSRIGMYKVYKLLYQQNCKPYKFIPRVYSHRQMEEYSKDYELNSILILLDKHIEYCSQKEHIFPNLKKLFDIKRKRGVEEEPLQRFIRRGGHLSRSRNHSYVVNMSMCLLMLKILEQERCKRFDSDRWTECKTDSRAYRMLLKFSRLPPCYDEYAKNQYSNLQIQFECSSTSRQSRWQTPSEQLILKLLFYKHYFAYTYPEGWGNLWVIKSIKTKEETLTRQFVPIDKETLVCKHIENMWRIDSSSRSRIEDSILFGRNVEIIQPVLIKSVDPLTFYMFSQAVYRIFDKHIDEASRSFEQLVSEQVFSGLMLGLQPDFSLRNLKSQIQVLVKAMVKVSSIYMAQINGCFQLLTFHIRLDENRNPWIVDIKKGSYMQKKLSKMKEHYVLGIVLNTLKIVMSRDYFKGQFCNQNHYWIELMKDKQRDVLEQIWLEVHGRKSHLHKRIFREEYSQCEEAKVAAITKIQRAIRSYVNLNQ